MSDEIDNQEIQEIKKELKKYIIKPTNYIMIRLIGKGGYAEVFLARNKKTGKSVAYKKLFKSLQPKQLTHFAREVSTMASVNHPFLLKFYGFSPNHPLAIVTEYIHNGSLFSYIHSESRRKKLTGSHRTLISMAIANAMAELHRIGIIHRDLKSLNILLDNDFLPRLGDFGIARYMNDDEPMTMRLGTPHWMAPETLKGNKNYGPEVDVYSFGMLLYELLTNSIPWEGKDPMAVATAVVHKVRPDLPKDTPKPLRELIESCWSQKPSERPTFTEIYDMFKNREVEFKGTEEKAIKWLVKIVDDFERKREERKNRRKSESDYSEYNEYSSSYSERNSKKKKKSNGSYDESNSRKKSKDKISKKIEEEDHDTVYSDDSFNSDEILRIMKRNSDESPRKKSPKNDKRRKQGRRNDSSSDSYSYKNETNYDDYDDYDTRISAKKAKSGRQLKVKKTSAFDTDDIYNRNRNKSKDVSKNNSDNILKKKKKQNTTDDIFQGRKYKNENSDSYSDDNRSKNRQTRFDKPVSPSKVIQEKNDTEKTRKSTRRPRYSDIPLPLRESSSQNNNLKQIEISQKKRMSNQSDSNLIYNGENNDFQSIVEQFRPIISSNTPILKKASILRHMAQQIMNDRVYAQSFINNDLHHRLPLSAYNDIEQNDDVKSIQCKQLIDACFDVFLSLFITVPEMLQENFEETMKNLIQISPRKSMILLANFSSKISQLDNPWPLLDLMLNESPSFLKNKSGSMLVMTLYYLCMNNKIFNESRLADSVVVFLDGIRTNNLNTIKSSYNSLCVFYDGDEEVDFEIISEHIKDDKVRENALNFLLRLEKIPAIDNLIRSLIDEAKNNEKASLCLIKIAQTKEGAMAIIENDTRWISEPIPTVEKTMQLFLSIVKYTEVARLLMNYGKRKETGLFNLSSPSFNLGSNSRNLDKSSNVTYSGRFDVTDSSELTMGMKLNSDVYEQIMQLYLLVCNSNDSNLLRAAAATIEAFSTFYHYNYSYSNNFNYTGINNAITLEFLAQMQNSKALLKMLKLALSLNNKTSINAGLVIIDILSDVDYAKEYVVFAGKICDLIYENSDKSDFAIHLATKLSKFDLCAKKFNDLKLKDYFLDLLKCKEYRDEAEYFIKNIDRYTQYY